MSISSSQLASYCFHPVHDMEPMSNPEANNLESAAAPEDAPVAAVRISEPSHTSIKMIPKVRKCSLPYFKNRFSANEDLYAVDVLEAESPEIGPQIQEELRLRQNVPKRRTKDRAKTGNISPTLVCRSPWLGHHKDSILGPVAGCGSRESESSHLLSFGSCHGS